MFAVILLGAWKMFSLFAELNLGEWLTIFSHLLYTFARVLVAVVVGTLLMIPIGVAIGLNPKFSRVLQPVAQVAASFPAPMLFPLVILALSGAGVGIEFGAVVLMMLGTQWYILFNVIAGAMANSAGPAGSCPCLAADAMANMEAVDIARNISLVSHRLGHGDRRRMECQHRCGVCSLRR